MKQILVAVIVLFACSAFAADVSESELVIREMIATLEYKKLQLSKEEQVKIDKVLVELKKFVPNVATAEKTPEKKKVDPIDLKKISPAFLAKKFSGKVAIKGDEIFIIYDFKNESQLKDFIFEKDKEFAPVAKNGLMIRSGTTVEHIAKFKTVTVDCVLAIGEYPPQAPAILMSGSSMSLRVGEWFKDSTVSIWAEGQELMSKKPIKKSTVNKIHYIAGNKKFGVTFNENQMLAKIKAEHAGSLVLHGGHGGIQVQTLVISGVPEEEWFSEFLK